MVSEGEERVLAYRRQQALIHGEPLKGAHCADELDALDSAILRLKIGLDRPIDRKAAGELADDLVNLQVPFSRVARCVGRTIARAR